jgi:hypothetical protein
MPNTLPKPNTKWPKDVVPPRPEEETEAPEEDFVEGALPGLPVSNDPLSQPSPIPDQRKKKPLD